MQNYKHNILAALGQECTTQNAIVLLKIHNDIAQDWEHWNAERTHPYYLEHKPDTPPASFVIDWVANKNFESISYWPEIDQLFNPKP
jgi:hypothetical protein